MGTTVLMLLRVSQLLQMKLGDNIFWKIMSAIGSLEGTSQTHCGGWKSIGDKPQEICVLDEVYADECIKF